MTLQAQVKVMGCLCGKRLKTTPEEVSLKKVIESKKRMCIWMVGAPGSGKGTQCATLAVLFKLAHLSTGDLLREKVKEDTPFANELRATMERGELVDSLVVLQLLTQAMKETYKNYKGYLIDGYPRKVEEGELFCRNIGNPHLIIYLECPDHVLKERLIQRGKESGRMDDNEDAIKTRLETFHKISRPVVDRWKGNVITIDGTFPKEHVEQNCIQAIRMIESQFSFD